MVSLRFYTITNQKININVPQKYQKEVSTCKISPSTPHKKILINAATAK